MISNMKTNGLKTILDRVERWPKAAQDDLATIALEIEAELEKGAYRATPGELELAGIVGGLRSAREGRLATSAEVDGIFAKFRRA
jgi:hypothetical protein